MVLIFGKILTPILPQYGFQELEPYPFRIMHCSVTIFSLAVNNNFLENGFV